MARPKATINSVDLTRALKAMTAIGLTISFTKFEPDGTITFGHSPEAPDTTSIFADEALSQWEASRRSNRLA